MLNSCACAKPMANRCSAGQKKAKAQKKQMEHSVRSVCAKRVQSFIKLLLYTLATVISHSFVSRDDDDAQNLSCLIHESWNSNGSIVAQSEKCTLNELMDWKARIRKLNTKKISDSTSIHKPHLIAFLHQTEIIMNIIIMNARRRKRRRRSGECGRQQQNGI